MTQVASPLLVQEKEHIPTLNYVFGGLAVLCEVVTIVCITRSVRELGVAWRVSLPRRGCREGFLPVANVLAVLRSKPPTPPSHSAARGERDRASYLQQLKDTFTCVPYLLLLLALGCGVALFSALATVAQQILCPLGYDEVSDNCSAPASRPHFLLGLRRCVVSLFLLHPPTH